MASQRLTLVFQIFSYLPEQNRLYFAAAPHRQWSCDIETIEASLYIKSQNAIFFGERSQHVRRKGRAVPSHLMLHRNEEPLAHMRVERPRISITGPQGVKLKTTNNRLVSHSPASWCLAPPCSARMRRAQPESSLRFEYAGDAIGQK